MADGDSGTGEPNVSEDTSALPYYLPITRLMGPSIPHYYGDYVRQIFVVTGAAMLLLAPFLIERAPTLLPFEVGGAIALVALAALTNPKKQWVMMANALAAGFGVVVFESFAIAAYSASNWLVFAALEAVAIAFLFALYFSIKTWRAMALGQIGRRPTFGEFVDE